MVNSEGIRELAYIVRIGDVYHHPNADRLDCCKVNGWNAIAGRDEFKTGDLAIYFEEDSLLPEVSPFNEMEFLKSKHYKIKKQKLRGVYSEGLLMPLSAFNWRYNEDDDTVIATIIEVLDANTNRFIDKVFKEGDFLTELLGVTYIEKEDNIRKANPENKYKKMAQRHSKLAKTKWWKWLYKSDLGKKILFIFFGKKKDSPSGWPVGKFPGVSKTDQERVENMPYILKDKTPYIETQKCDGSSATYILERKLFGRFEFYVCSRNVRMFKPDQKCFYDDKNYYWEVAIKYNIEDKMKCWMKLHPDATFLCWQGEICAPGIQKNPHHLKTTHFYCFHWTDSIHGRIDIREADYLWRFIGMEVVPITDTNFILPDDLEEFKLHADGMYDSSVCEGQTNCPREGYVYYNTEQPEMSFKNVSREYLINLHN